MQFMCSGLTCKSRTLQWFTMAKNMSRSKPHRKCVQISETNCYKTAQLLPKLIFKAIYPVEMDQHFQIVRKETEWDCDHTKIIG